MPSLQQTVKASIRKHLLLEMATSLLVKRSLIARSLRIGIGVYLEVSCHCEALSDWPHHCSLCITSQDKLVKTDMYADFYSLLTCYWLLELSSLHVVFSTQCCANILSCPSFLYILLAKCEMGAVIY